MKKICLLIMVTFVVMMSANAQKVTEAEAREKAVAFLQGKRIAEPVNTSKMCRAPRKGASTDAYYVFNVENDGGFVVVSGDERTEAILGYADKGELNLDKAPDNVKWLFDYYEKVISAYDEKTPVQKRKVSERKTIEPLLKTQWDQMDPYNKYCPEWVGTGLRYPAGCVAVAMAQILNYYQWPQGEIKPLKSYISAENNIVMPELPSTSFDWENMTEDDIARLMLYCGQSVEMQYDEEGSGAYTGNEFDNTLIQVFNYSKGLRSLARSGLYTDEEWEKLVYEELFAGRPMFYTGDKSGKSHAFVVDGYNNGRFHINWGWSGDYDGYFLISGLTTDEELMPYNKHQTATFYIQLPADVMDTGCPKVNVKDTFCATQTISRESISDDFPEISYYCQLANNVAHEITLNIGYGLYYDDELVKVLSQEQHTFAVDESFVYNNSTTISADVVDGDYCIVAICRENDNEQWKMATGANSNCLKMIVDGLSFTIRSMPNYSDSEDYIDYGIHDIDGITYQLSFQNSDYVAQVLPYNQIGQYSGEIYIPDEIEYLDNKFRIYRAGGVFWSCDNLTSLSIGNLLEGSDIWNCPNLSQIEIREGYWYGQGIGSCPALEEIVLPTTLSQIPYNNFLVYCDNLKKIRFTGEILVFREIPNWGNSSLPSLTDIYFPMAFPPAVEDWEGNSLGDVPANNNATIHIPQGTLRLYQQSQWKEWNLVEDLSLSLGSMITWGYCHDKTFKSFSGSVGVASGASDNDIEYAIRVLPAELDVYKGCHITSLEVFSEADARNRQHQFEYEYVFVTTPQTDYIIKQPCKVVRGKWNTIQLKEPYMITGEELFIGVGRHSTIGMGFTNNNYQPDALWARAMGNDNSCIWELGKWDNLGKSRELGHPLPLRFTIEGNNVPQGAVIRELAVAEGDGLNIQAVVRNRSLGIVQSYTVNWVADDGQTGSHTFETYMLPNTSETITIPLPTSLGTGYHTVTFDIPTLDGKENGLKGLNVPTIDLVNGAEGVVVFANNYTREYGEENPTMEFGIRGLTPNGTPEISCDASITSPAGEYPIIVKPGTITNENVAYVNGTLTVAKAPLTVTVNDSSMGEGAVLPEFTLTYEGFKNGETEAVLTKHPVAATDVTAESPAGEYAVTLSGGEAQNYEFNYVDGLLQVLVRGNITGSGAVNVQDATLVVNYILGNVAETARNYNYSVADMNNDGEVDVFDVTKMIGVILSGESAAKQRRLLGTPDVDMKEQLNLHASADGVTVDVADAGRFTSFQMEVEAPRGVKLTGARLVADGTDHIVKYAQVGENRYRVLALSMSSTPLITSADGMLELSLSGGDDVTADNILFVTSQGEAVRFAAQSLNTVTGIDAITSALRDGEVYDLSGRKVSATGNQLPKGVYIVNKKKVVVK